MSNLAEKCMHLKPSANNGLTGLLVGILSENPEVSFNLSFQSFLHSYIYIGYLRIQLDSRYLPFEFNEQILVNHPLESSGICYVVSF